MSDFLVGPEDIMSIGVIDVPSRKELFVNRIEEQILTGRLKVGDSLPSERQLQEETHISKTVIHAGLVDLEQKGFLESLRYLPQMPIPLQKRIQKQKRPPLMQLSHSLIVSNTRAGKSHRLYIFPSIYAFRIYIYLL